MTSSRPYLIRAIYQWVVDNGMTPHLMVNAVGERVVVPREYVENEKIVLNIGPMAINVLTLGNEDITFSARFSGQPMEVVVPVDNVLAIYARENGQGMMFAEEDNPPPDSGPGSDGPDQKPTTRPALKLIK